MTVRTRILIVAAAFLLLSALLIVTRLQFASYEFRAAFDAEFLTRPDGYPGLQKHYGLRFPVPPMQMNPGLMYRSIADNAVDVINGFATDGRIPAYNLTPLKDDRDYFPPYDAAPLVRKATLDLYPELKTVISELGGRISAETMRNLNFQVDEKGFKARRVARRYLEKNGLIKKTDRKNDSPTGRITVGGKQFTEQEILGEMLALLIECKTSIGVQRKLNLGGTMICFNALKAGDLDLYVEYTGTGLVSILKQKVIADPEKSYTQVKKVFSRRFNLIWLEPFGFNNTYTLTMRTGHARHLGIESISDLKRYIEKEFSPDS